MKVYFTLSWIILISACGNTDRMDSTVPNSQNFLHNIELFTDDSLVNVVIEIPAGSIQKWEINKETGQIEWEQVAPDSMRIIDYLAYPANYGFVPQTLLPKKLGGDGDPMDVFVLGESVERASILKVKIIGIIHMIDNNESDSKLLAVNTNKAGIEANSLEMLNLKYPGAVEIIKLWLLNYKGSGSVEILSVKNQKEAIAHLERAHFEYLNLNNN